jgi:5-methyltetrahydrofolate--homocysteine methyltransferase
MVTMGSKASEHSAKLYAANDYKEYLYLPRTERRIRRSTGGVVAQKDPRRTRRRRKDAKEIKRLFSQGYQGSRYSFGYPACPNLEDHTKLFELLHPEQIGVHLTEEFMLEPEQSTDAIIVHHPEAKYFNIK